MSSWGLSAYNRLGLQPRPLHCTRLCRVSIVFRCACALPLENVEALALGSEGPLRVYNGPDVRVGTRPSCREHCEACRADGVIFHRRFIRKKPLQVQK